MNQALLIAIPAVAAVLSVVVGMGQVHALRERTGDKSLLTAILSFEFDAPIRKRAKNS